MFIDAYVSANSGLSPVVPRDFVRIDPDDIELFGDGEELPLGYVYVHAQDENNFWGPEKVSQGDDCFRKAIDFSKCRQET